MLLPRPQLTELPLMPQNAEVHGVPVGGKPECACLSAEHGAWLAGAVVQWRRRIGAAGSTAAQWMIQVARVSVPSCLGHAGDRMAILVPASDHAVARPSPQPAMIAGVGNEAAESAFAVLVLI